MIISLESWFGFRTTRSLHTSVRSSGQVSSQPVFRRDAVRPPPRVLKAFRTESLQRLMTNSQTAQHDPRLPPTPRHRRRQHARGLFDLAAGRRDPRFARGVVTTTRQQSRSRRLAF